MDLDFLQAQRYKVQQRFRRVHSAGRWQTYGVAMRHFLAFLEERPLFAAVLEHLEARQPEAEETVARIAAGEALLGDSEEETAALGLQMLRKAVEAGDQRFGWRIARAYGIHGDTAESMEYLNEAFIEPLYEYVDEQVDERGAVLALIRRYKQRVEWFERERLFELRQQNTAAGEAELAKDLYRYLFDRGVELFIEPASVSGEIDLVAAQGGDDRLLADAKVFHPGESKGRTYLAKGFKQLYTYCVDFNQPVGYLVVFRVSSHDLRFVVADAKGFVPRITYNHKTIFLVDVDLFPHEQPASKRGKLDPYEVTEEKLVGELASAG